MILQGSNIFTTVQVKSTSKPAHDLHTNQQTHRALRDKPTEWYGLNKTIFFLSSSNKNKKGVYDSQIKEDGCIKKLQQTRTQNIH